MAREQRRLAAIMAADVVGFSRLMGRDESGTLARLKLHRAERFEPALAHHGGRLVKLIGDGALVEFASAVDALSAAIAFQQAMADANAREPEDARLVFRIGVHLGDLIVDGDDVYGDSVNVAARLEAEAPPGGILVSRNVHDAVVRRVEATLASVGQLALKNIEEPMQAFRVSWHPSDWPLSAAPARPAPDTATRASDPAPQLPPDKPSIAVLPFQNMSGDAEQDYFADGMAEDIITALSRFRSLFVIARNSSFAFKGKAIDIKQVGRELGVRYVLEGSVRKASGRLRVTAQLIDAASGGHLWAERFDGALADVFDLQDRITDKAVGAIAPKLEEAEMARAGRKAAGNLAAHDCYWRGLAALGSGGSKDALVEALRLAYRAIELDPDHAPAYGLAMFCYANRRGYGLADTSPQADKAEIERLFGSAVRKGRDDAQVLGHTAYAVAYVLRDLPVARRLVDRALEINPNQASAWAQSGWIRLWLGEPEVAIEHLHRAMRHDPMQVVGLRSALAHACFFLDLYDDAVMWAEQQLLQHSASHPCLRIGAAAAGLAGRLDVARRMAGRLQAIDPAFRVSRYADYLGPYQRADFLEKYAEGLRRAGLPE